MTPLELMGAAIGLVVGIFVLSAAIVWVGFVAAGKIYGDALT